MIIIMISFNTLPSNVQRRSFFSFGANIKNVDFYFFFFSKLGQHLCFYHFCGNAIHPFPILLKTTFLARVCAIASTFMMSHISYSRKLESASFVSTGLPCYEKCTSELWFSSLDAFKLFAFLTQTS